MTTPTEPMKTTATISSEICSLTDRMKNLNNDIHRDLENSPFMRALLADNLNTAQYLQYLVDLGEIFAAIEGALEGDHAEYLKPFYRAASIQNDCAAIPEETPKPSKEAEQYKTLLKKIGFPEILAHVYTHLLAMLYGGQIQKKHIIKKWDQATALYTFEEAEEKHQKTGRELAVEFKTWLNQLPFTSKEQDAIIKESAKAFALMGKILLSYDMTDSAEKAKKKAELEMQQKIDKAKRTFDITG